MKFSHARDIALLFFLAFLWGSSYLLIKIAVAEIPPVTLIAIRVLGAALFLLVVMALRSEKFPRDAKMWRSLSVQSFLNSTGAWTILAWGQQFVEAGLASVLNSTSPMFVFLMSTLFVKGERASLLNFCGAILGMVGVVLIVGPNVLQGLGQQVLGQLACLTGAALYAGAAVYGRRFHHLPPVTTAAGTMICASVVLVPLALALDQPWRLTPSVQAMASAAALSLLCTGLALLIYFRLLRSLGPMGVASQSYLRAGIGVALATVLLGENFSASVLAGLLTAIMGVALINWPSKKKISSGKTNV